MSYVTNIIISCPCGDVEEEAMKTLLKGFTDEIGVKEFMCIDTHNVGGNRNVESVLFIAAFEHLNCHSFVEFIKSLKNTFYNYHFDDIQIFIKNENHDIWKIVRAYELTEDDF
jgi:hypothetical protein